ncbi:hypothetical protein [Brevundimonas sp.]|uniref:hypothetical protein n=1 Tax=Brevundimonas sp. TaxID=1871086 RepID=UPI002625269E|nr:hypothetical protein [Brevundimonas sp.]
MANSYRTIEPCTLGEIIEAALEDGFTVTDEVLSDGPLVMCGLIHDDGRGCYDMSEEQADDGLTYVGCMHDPKVPGHEMDVDHDS